MWGALAVIGLSGRVCSTVDKTDFIFIFSVKDKYSGEDRLLEIYILKGGNTVEGICDYGISEGCLFQDEFIK